MTMSTQSFKSCPQCGVDVHVARRRCVCGCNLKRHGRPKGTTRLKGYGVGTSGGRPVGTTAKKGFSTGGGRVPDYKVGKHIEFRGIDLPDKWDSSKDKINLTLDILERCAQRVMQQRCFDKKPLAKALC